MTCWADSAFARDIDHLPQFMRGKHPVIDGGDHRHHEEAELQLPAYAERVVPITAPKMRPS